MPKSSARPSKRPAPAANVTARAPGGDLSTAQIVIWGWLVAYLSAFFLTPLANLPAGSEPLRRTYFWLTILLGDESMAAWFRGASFVSLTERLVLLALAGAILIVAQAAGWLCLQLLGAGQRLTRLEQFVFSSAVGLSLVSLATLLLGLGGLLHQAYFIALAVLVVVTAGYRMLGRAGSANSCWAGTAREEDTNSSGLTLSDRWLWLALPFVLVIVASAMLPPVDFDVREYHLQAPKEFYQQGRITFVPHNVYANMPLGAEMLPLVGMVITGDWWQGALVGKLLIACFAPLTALALLACGRRYVSPAAGIVAALVYISIPWVVLVSTQGLIDGVLGCYLFLAFYAAWMWHDGPRPSTYANRSAPLAILAGFLAGSALAVKYTGAVYSVAPLAGFFACACLQSFQRQQVNSLLQAFLPFLLLTLGSALACGPWLVKNWVLAGNPTYPLLYGIFGGNTRTPELDAQWARAHAPPNFAVSDLLHRAVGIVLTSDWLSPLVVSLAVLALVNPRSRRLAGATVGYFAFIFAAWWLLTHRIDRFWVPALSLAALLAGIGATWSASSRWRGTLAALAVVGLSYDFAVIAGGYLIDNRYLADLNTLREDPSLVEPWHQWLNDHASEVKRVLLVADAQPFDLQVPTSYNTVFDANLLEQIARDRTPEEVRRTLEQRGISHIYVSWREIDRYRSPGNYGITDFLQTHLFDDLVAAGVLEALPPLPDDSGQMYRVRDARP